MDEEKMQRQMEFIVEQQAQFAVQQTQSAARLAQLEELLVRFAQATRERFNAADQRSQEMDEKIAALINAQIRADDRVAGLDNWLRESRADFDKRLKESAADFDRRYATLVEAQKKTEEAVRKMGERVDNLAATVDRHIVEGHNGKTGT